MFNYKTKYFVDYHIKYLANENKLVSLNVLEVFELLKTKDNLVLMITPDKWKNIALLPLRESNLSKLISAGAELVDSSYLYDDTTDAKIQMAFTAAKYNVKANEIYEISNGKLNEKVYRQLHNIFYEDFPEKFI